jgi:GntR family transcriptional regulator
MVRDPVYQQLSRALRARIASGEIAFGEQFLTERQVAQRYQVSRPTANKALGGLVAEGLLLFRKGIGTFVAGGAKTLDYDLRTLVSFTDKAKASGKTPVTKVLRFEKIGLGGSGEGIRPRRGGLRRAPFGSEPQGRRQSSRVALAREKLGEDEDLFFIERLRLADGVPVILERRYIVARFCPTLREADVRGSLYAAWTDKFHLAIDGAEQAISGMNVGKADGRLLGVRAGSAGLLVTATGFLAGEAPLWFEQTLYRADSYEFHTRLSAEHFSRPAVGRFSRALAV